MKPLLLILPLLLLASCSPAVTTRVVDACACMAQCAIKCGAKALGVCPVEKPR